MHKKSLLFSVFLCSTLVSTLTLAKIYEWTDDEGNKVFSQTPPPDNRPTKAITPPPPPAESEDTREEVERIQKKLDNMAEERKKKEQAKKQVKEEARQKAQRCALARENLKTIQERPPNTLWGMPDGSYQRFTVEERQQQIDKMKKIIKENCK